MVGVRQATAFHKNTDTRGRKLTPAEREKLLQPYLPEAPRPSTKPTRSPIFQHKQRVRPAIRQLLYNVIYTVIHIFFSTHIRLRRAYHAVVDRIIAILFYHHRTPALIQRDVKSLSRVPQHLSVVLTLPPEGGSKDRLGTLVNDVGEIAAWCASAGIPMLSVYERTGVLKSFLPHVHRRISRTMDAYFGATTADKPTISLRAPHQSAYSPPHSPTGRAIEPETDVDLDSSTSLQSPPRAKGDPASDVHRAPHLNVLLIDAADGRQTLVDLTKTLAEMAQRGKLTPGDVSQELIDAEMVESCMGEPDLMIVFGDRVLLDGYPPWQMRLTEIYHVQDNVHGVGYQVFLRALFNYAKAQMRFGR